MSPTPAGRWAWHRSLMSAQGRPAYVADVRQEYARIAAAHARGEEAKQRLSLKDARANALKLNWSGNDIPQQPTFLGTRVLRGLSDRGASRLHRLVAVLRHLGAHRQVSRDPRRREIWRGGAQPVRGRAGDARPHCIGALVPRQRRRSASGRRIPRATTSSSTATNGEPSRLPCCTRCASNSPGAKVAPTWHWPISSLRARARSPTTSAPSW